MQSDLSQIYERLGRIDGTLGEFKKSVETFIGNDRDAHEKIEIRMRKVESEQTRVKTIAGVVGGVVGIVVTFFTDFVRKHTGL